MPIPVTPEPEPEAPLERCCFCRKGTWYWHSPKDVPVCLACAETHEPEQVLSKLDWLASEDKRTNPIRVT